jgi:hypothetical protein
MKRPLYYLLCAIACTSMIGATMPMATIAEAMQPQETAEQQAQADATSSDTDKIEETTSSNATDSSDPTSDTQGNSDTPVDATNATDTPTPATPNPQPSLRAQANSTPEAITTAAETGYAHNVTANQNGVTLTLSWDDAAAGEPTRFHLSATGGSGAYKFRMDAPFYMNPGEGYFGEMVADTSRGQWMTWTSSDTGCDYEFTMTASGRYYYRFYLQDAQSSVWSLRVAAEAEVSDDAHPSIDQIITNAVAQCRQETSGSEYDMALWLHDWTLDQLEYDHSLNWCSAESGLTRHQGTCESYQRIYSKLLDAAGIANGRITGNGHTWNAVKIDGKWCQMDLTWDDTSDNWYGDLDQRHLYFGLTDELMAIAHSDHTANYQMDDYAYRSTDLSNNYFVRNGKADEWAGKYADRIQEHLDAKEESFSIDADNQSFPPSISGIQNGIVAYAMNLREWKIEIEQAELKAASIVTTQTSTTWIATFKFTAKFLQIKPAATPVLPNGMYSIYSCLDQSKALDVRMESKNDRANVQLWQDHGGRQQKVNLQFQNDGTYLITFVHSGKAMSAESNRDGSNVSQSSLDGSDLQRWVVERMGAGYTIKNKAGNQWLNVRRADTRNGTNIQTWSNGGVSETIFNLVPTELDALPNGRYAIKTKLDTTKTIDIRLASQDDFANAQIWTDYNSPNQSVDLRRQGDGTYTFIFVHSKKALTAEAVKDGANVSQATYTGSNLQHWKLSKHKNGFTVQLAEANEYLNVRLAMARDGANVQTWSNGGTIETLFMFEMR